MSGGSVSVTSLCFSVNGYLLATGNAQGAVDLWDLRKAQNVCKVEVGDGNVTDTIFDKTGEMSNFFVYIFTLSAINGSRICSSEN